MRKQERELIERWRKEASEGERKGLTWFCNEMDKLYLEYLTGAKEVQEARTKADGGS